MAQLPFSWLSNVTAPSVAVIGAGPGGSALSYYLNQLSPAVDITVYEASDYIGGRSTTVDVLGQPIELGASIFVDVNTNLVDAANLFNLTLVDPEETLKSTQQGLGIWNGEEFVYRDDGGWRLVNLAKLVWRYGLSPYRAQKHVAGIIDRFLGTYKALPFDSLETMANEAGLTQYTNVTSQQAYARSGVSDMFIGDVISAATRVNYAQSPNTLHGLMGAVAFVTDDAKAVKGGNWQIFCRMLKASEATVHLETPVKTITQQSDRWQVCDIKNCKDYDHVVVAAPWAQTNMTVVSETTIDILPVEYVVLHITIVATVSLPSRQYFNAQSVPSSILTSSSSGDELEFFSFSVVGNAGDKAIYKLFSHSNLDDAALTRLFDDGIGAEDTIVRKVWHAYPKGAVTSKFDEWEVASNLWYLNGMERFISTMETATLAGRNVAGLIHQRLQAD